MIFIYVPWGHTQYPVPFSHTHFLSQRTASCPSLSISNVGRYVDACDQAIHIKCDKEVVVSGGDIIIATIDAWIKVRGRVEMQVACSSYSSISYAVFSIMVSQDSLIWASTMFRTGERRWFGAVLQVWDVSTRTEKKLVLQFSFKNKKQV